jgi:hypothetical protein
MRHVLVSGLAVALFCGAAMTAFADGVPPIGKRPVVGPGGRPIVGFPAMKPQKVKFSVEIDEKGKEVRLLVPMQFMLGGLGFPGGIGGGGFVPGGVPAGFGVGGIGGGVAPGIGFTGVIPPGVVPPGVLPPGVNPPKPNPAATDPKPSGKRADASELRLPTIIAGLALTATFVSGGLWMARRGAGRGLVGILIVCMFVAGAAMLWADIGPPFRPRPPVVVPEVPKGTPVKLPATVELNDKITLEILPVGDTIRLLVPKSVVKGADADK